MLSPTPETSRTFWREPGERRNHRQRYDGLQQRPGAQTHPSDGNHTGDGCLCLDAARHDVRHGGQAGFGLLAHFVGGSGTTTAYAEVRAANGKDVLWRGDTVAMPDLYGGLLDFGVVPLPPGGYSTAYGALTLALTFTGVALRYLDFIQLTPMDAFTMIECVAPCANGETVVADSIENRQYIVSGSAELSYASASGGELLLHPGRDQPYSCCPGKPDRHEPGRNRRNLHSYRALPSAPSDDLGASLCPSPSASTTATTTPCRFRQAYT